MAKLKRKKNSGETDDEHDLRLGQEIVKVLLSLPAGATEVDRLALIAAIKPLIATSGVVDGVNKRYGFDVILDPIEKNNEKFAFIVIPAPEPKRGEEICEWAADYYQDDETKRNLGKAVLFGCGR